MKNGVPIRILYRGTLVGEFKTIKEGSFALEDFYIDKLKFRNRPNFYCPIVRMIKIKQTPKINSVLYGVVVEVIQ